jgi:hypothetical protein
MERPRVEATLDDAEGGIERGDELGDVHRALEVLVAGAAIQGMGNGVVSPPGSPANPHSQDTR